VYEFALIMFRCGKRKTRHNNCLKGASGKVIVDKKWIKD